MNNFKIILVVAIACLDILKIYAQNITGNVVGEDRQTLSFANVVLLKADSTYITGTVTDDAGAFSISRHHDAKYLNVSYIGYVPRYLEITADSIGTIRLQPDASMLGEVVVVAARPVIKREVDRLVFNVEATPLSQGSNVLDLLKQTPLVKATENSIGNREKRCQNNAERKVVLPEWE